VLGRKLNEFKSSPSCGLNGARKTRIPPRHSAGKDCSAFSMRITIETDDKQTVTIERKGYIQVHDYIEVFKGALVAIGFHPRLLDEHLNEGEWYEESDTTDSITH
jgi:hypothetical protein